MSIQDWVYDAASGYGCSVLLRLASEAIDSVWPAGTLAAWALAAVGAAVGWLGLLAVVGAAAGWLVAAAAGWVAAGAEVAAGGAGVGAPAEGPDCGAHAASNKLKLARAAVPWRTGRRRARFARNM